jgi:hypothetical protein
MALVIRSYVKESVLIVKKQSGLMDKKIFNNHTKSEKKKQHHARKLSAIEDNEDSDFDDEDSDFDNEDINIEFRQKESQMRKFMEIIKQSNEEDDVVVETAESHFDNETPAWMRKGMFAQENKSHHGITFEPETVEDKKHNNRKDKKQHNKHGKKDKQQNR